MLYSFARSVLALPALLGVATSLDAQTPDTIYNVVELHLVKDGNVIGTPRLVVKDGGSVTTTVAGDNGYSLILSVSTIGGSDPLQRRVSSEIYLPENDKWILVGKPTIDMVPGSESSVLLTIASEIAGRRANSLEIKVNLRSQDDRRVRTVRY